MASCIGRVWRSVFPGPGPHTSGTGFRSSARQVNRRSEKASRRTFSNYDARPSSVHTGVRSKIEYSIEDTADS